MKGRQRRAEEASLEIITERAVKYGDKFEQAWCFSGCGQLKLWETPVGDPRTSEAIQSEGAQQMVLDHMECKAAFDADSNVWIFLFSLSSFLMLLICLQLMAKCYSSVLSLWLVYMSRKSLSGASRLTLNLPLLLFATLTSDLCEAKVCPNKEVPWWIVAAKEAEGLADQ